MNMGFIAQILNSKSGSMIYVQIRIRFNMEYISRSKLCVGDNIFVPSKKFQSHILSIDSFISNKFGSSYYYKMQIWKSLCTME